MSKGQEEGSGRLGGGRGIRGGTQTIKKRIKKERSRREAGSRGRRRTYPYIWGGNGRSFATAVQKEIPKCRARPQQGRKATEREGEDPLSPRCQAKEGRGPPLGRKRRGGPAYRQSYLPAYTGKPRQLRQARAGRRNRGK